MIGGFDHTNPEAMAHHNKSMNYHIKIKAAKRRIFDALEREGVSLHGMKHKKRISTFLTMFDIQRPIEIRMDAFIIKLYEQDLLPELTPKKKVISTYKLTKDAVDERRQKYLDYLKSPEWRKIREEAIIHWGSKCVLCCSENKLQGHHRTYKNLYNETVDDVVPLCRKCHKIHHGK